MSAELDLFTQTSVMPKTKFFSSGPTRGPEVCDLLPKSCHPTAFRIQSLFKIPIISDSKIVTDFTGTQVSAV